MSRLADGSEETVTGGDRFYGKPGHTVRVGAGAEIILFRPRHEHGEVVEHRKRLLAG